MTSIRSGAVAATLVLFGVGGGEATAQIDSTAAAPVARRASWLSDAVSLRTGDILTVIIDERTSASERSSEHGSEARSLQANFSADADGDVAVGRTGIGSRWSADSRNLGGADRRGDLLSTLSARVLDVDAQGVARIVGKKTVILDGRSQEVSLSGFVRSEDVSSSNVVLSSHVAEASISYEGTDIKPKKGILGKIVSIIWPF